MVGLTEPSRAEQSKHLLLRGSPTLHLSNECLHCICMLMPLYRSGR